MRKRVLVSQRIDEAAVALLTQAVDVLHGDPANPFALLPEVDGVIVRTAILDGTTIARAPRLRVIARHGVGVDNVDVAAASARGIFVTNTPDANHQSVAEHVVGSLLAISRHLLIADQHVRAGDFDVRSRLIGLELFGRTLAIVGFGRVGRSLATICARGFNMHVRAYDPYLPADAPPPGVPVELVGSLAELLPGSDFLSVHVPLTPVTRGMIGPAELGLLPRHAIVVNAARGGVIEESALAEALQNGTLRGAAIDVFAEEPPPPDHPFMGLKNVLLTPHMAAHTEEAMRRMAVGAAEEVLRVLRGEPPLYATNAADVNRYPA